MTIVKAIKKNNTGRNILFIDIDNNHKMNRQDFINRIKNKNSVYHKNYVVKIINGIETPVSKPDKDIENNLE